MSTVLVCPGLQHYQFNKNILVHKTKLLSQQKLKDVAQSFDILWKYYVITKQYLFYRL